MKQCKGIEILGVNDQTFLSLILACAGHDVDHPGHNNLFESKNKSILATIYNDKSILENHHCATLFKLL
jgi:3'5'-cyclic nucleotide phosphodiesterase